MVKKRLTKAQVKRELGKMHAAIGRLFVDRVKNPDSFVPMSEKVLLELNKKIRSTFMRVK